MSITYKPSVMATSEAPPPLLQQVGMAGTAAVITVSFIHPIDVIKVRITFRHQLRKLVKG